MTISTTDRFSPQAGSIAGGGDIDRRRRLAHPEFVAEYLRPLKPVVLVDAIDHWPALGAWTPDFFRTAMGEREVLVDNQWYRLADLIALIEASSAGKPAPYLRNLPIAEWAPELMSAIMPMPECTQPNWFDSWLFIETEAMSAVELYIGGAGATFPVLHYDNMHTHAFLMQLHGTKEYVAYSPDQSALLYPRPDIERNKSSIPDIDHPDLERFPRFSDAHAQHTLLQAGETLFMPAGWWHTARILEPSITVSINTANAANWASFTTDYVASVRRRQPKWRATAMSLYLALFGLIEQWL